MSSSARKVYGVVRTILKITYSVLAGLGLMWVVSVLCVIGFAMHDGADPDDGASADAIVVLGAAQYDGRPSPVLKARIDHAINLWNDSVATYMVFTGGKGTGDTTSEARVSGDYAIRRGVPQDNILMESEGRTTSASMHAVASILQERDLGSVVLVSDPFHMFRLWLTSHRLGLVPITSPTRTSPIGANTAKNATYILHESIKAPIAFILG